MSDGSMFFPWKWILAIFNFFRNLCGAWKALVRLGSSLHNRVIHIVFDNHSERYFNDIKDMLTAPGLIKNQNIYRVSESNLAVVRDSTLIIFVWSPDLLQKTLNEKNDAAALIIYAPPDKGIIPTEAMREITMQRNTIVVNHRGRLMNDVFISMMTTERK